MQKFSGWRDIDSFERWEARSADSDREAVQNLYRREARETHSQMIARRGLVALFIAALTAGAIWWLKWGPK